MYRKILVPTDGSEPSRNAFRHAVDVARMSQGKILLLHITFTPQSYWGNNLAFGLNISEEELKELGKSAIDETTQDIDYGSIPISSEVVSGSPWMKIIETAARENPDIIIMGSSGHGPFKGAFLGSVSQRVLAKASCPVMIVKHPNYLPD